MDNNKVFARYELKFILSIEQFNKIKNIICKYMCKDKYFNTKIRNIFYDTPNYYLIRNSIEKPEYKEKIRLRTYKTIRYDEDVFVEIKKKYKKKVYKRREILPYNVARLFLEQKVIPNSLQITKEINYAINYYKELMPVIYLSYEREAYKGITDETFRVTFDRNIIWRDYNIDLTEEVYGEQLLSSDKVLMEVKTNMGLPRWLLDFLSENHIYKQSFSKYGNVYEKLIKRKEEKNND